MEGRMKRVWWPRAPRPGNLGDVLTPAILRGLGVEARWTPHQRADLLAIGSIIRFARPGQSVWGSGAMRRSDPVSPRARYLAVRGPFTRDSILRDGGTCPEVYGDPALLVSRFHDRPVEKRHDVGVVPHYVDERDVRRKHRGLSVISPLRANPLEVVDEIRACRAILSSSLHGIIVAHAYGIPAAWVRFSDKLNGDDVKFADYAASVGVELVPYKTVDAAEPVVPGPIDLDPLVAAAGAICP